MKKVWIYLLAGLNVAILSFVYNFLIFRFFDFYPDLPFEFMFFGDSARGFYAFIFLKGFFVGLILMFFYTIAYSAICSDRDFKGISFFILYAVFALFVFTFGDVFLMENQNRMFVLLTVDGVVESMIATIPIRFFYFFALER